MSEAFTQAAEVAIEALQNARERTDNYEDDLEYERAIDGLKKAFEGMKEGAAERIADLESKLLLICAAIGDWNTHGAHTPCGCAVCAELSDIARKLSGGPG